MGKRKLILFLLFACGTTFANIDVELDVILGDSTVQCRYLYVLSPAESAGRYDTLVAFDTLSFNAQRRMSLFYSVKTDKEHILSIVDSAGMFIESKPFAVTSQRAAYTVVVDREKISVTSNDYYYPQQNEDFIYLMVFFGVKFLMTIIFVMSSKFPKRIVSIASGAFLLSALIDLHFDISYLYRFLLILLADYLLIAFVARKSISPLWASIFVLTVNLAGYGVAMFLYLFYVYY